jgi:hypothetical protein
MSDLIPTEQCDEHCVMSDHIPTEQWSNIKTESCGVELEPCDFDDNVKCEAEGDLAPLKGDLAATLGFIKTELAGDLDHDSDHTMQTSTAIKTESQEVVKTEMVTEHDLCDLEHSDTKGEQETGDSNYIKYEPRDADQEDFLPTERTGSNFIKIEPWDAAQVNFIEAESDIDNSNYINTETGVADLRDSVVTERMASYYIKSDPCDDDINLAEGRHSDYMKTEPGMADLGYIKKGVVDDNQMNYSEAEPICAFGPGLLKIEVDDPLHGPHVKIEEEVSSPDELT